MSKLTPAQIAKLAEQLRELEYTSCDQAATLIEQQAEQIAALTRDCDKHARNSQARLATIRDHQRWREYSNEALDKAESEAAALRKAIEDAPHDNPYCSDPTDEKQECYCWKSNALPEKETE